MKRYISLFIMTCCILLVGCFETTQEVTINKNGSGIFTNTTDLSNMIGLLKQMGGDEANKMQNTDTTIALTGIADSIAGLTAEQRRIVNKGTMKLTLNMQDEKLLVKLKALQKSLFVTRAFMYLDIISWLESKLENIPVQEIMKRKFEAKRKSHASVPSAPESSPF